jgi:nitrite reductase/ring-hydroxylating ferredoxin subunit
MEDKQPPLFNNKDALAQGWYVAARSSDLKPGQVKPVSLLGLDFAAFRGEDGKARVVLARCPHMGAHLGQGHVSGNNVVCPFHWMHVNGDGKCAEFPSDPAAKARFATTGFEVDERWGQIWFHLGSEPRYRLDVFAKQVANMDRMLFGRCTYPLHHHVMVPNALDYVHFDVVHGMVAKRFDFTHSELSLKAHIDFQLTERAPKLIRFFGIKNLELIFETYGGNTFLVEVMKPYRMSFLTNYSPMGDGTTLSSTAAFFPKVNPLWKLTGIPFVQRVIQMLFVNAFFADDEKVTHHIKFSPKFMPNDKYYMEFVKHCAKLKRWPEEKKSA